MSELMPYEPRPRSPARREELRALARRLARNPAVMGTAAATATVVTQAAARHLVRRAMSSPTIVIQQVTILVTITPAVDVALTP